MENNNEIFVEGSTPEISTPEISTLEISTLEVSTKSVYEELQEVKSYAIQLQEQTALILQTIETIENQLSHQLWNPQQKHLVPRTPHAQALCTTIHCPTPLTLPAFLQFLNNYLVDHQLIDHHTLLVNPDTCFREAFSITTQTPYVRLFEKIPDLFEM